MQRLVAILLLGLATTSRVVESHFLSGLMGKKEYTPLLFFKVPKGASPECTLKCILCTIFSLMLVNIYIFDVLQRYTLLFDFIVDVQFVIFNLLFQYCY